MRRTKEEKERINKKYGEETTVFSNRTSQVTLKAKESIKNIVDEKKGVIVCADTDSFIYISEM